MKFSGVSILQGIEFSIFPINFECALQQCSATAPPVMFIFFNCNTPTKVAVYLKRYMFSDDRDKHFSSSCLDC